MNKKLFIRVPDHINNYQHLKNCWNKQLNVDSLEHWTLKKTVSLFKLENENAFVYYRFEILRNWIDNQDDSSQIFIKKLIRNITILNLNGFLNAFEQNYLLDITSNNFTLNRNLKSLVVDFELAKKEVAYFHYHKIHLYTKFWEPMLNMEFYLTTKRIVITHGNDQIFFNIDKITKFSFYENGFNIFYYNNLFKFVYDKPSLILLSLKRLYKEIKQELVYE